jgi:hypothetical protein
VLNTRSLMGCWIGVFGRFSDYRSPSADQLENQGDDRQNQQYVDESAHGIAAHNTQQPEHQQNYKNRPKHLVTSASFSLLHKLEAEA